MFHNHPQDDDGETAYYIIHHPVYYITHLVATVLLMLLALVEKPSVFAIDEEDATLVCSSLVPRPTPSFPSLAVRLSGRGPGTFPHVSDVTDRANYANVGVM